jgi:hypothetical protein
MGKKKGELPQDADAGIYYAFLTDSECRAYKSEIDCLTICSNDPDVQKKADDRRKEIEKMKDAMCDAAKKRNKSLAPLPK